LSWEFNTIRSRKREEGIYESSENSRVSNAEEPSRSIMILKIFYNIYILYIQYISQIFIRKEKLSIRSRKREEGNPNHLKIPGSLMQKKIADPS